MANEIESGAIIWARKTIESSIFTDKPDKWFKIWFYLVAKAQHSDSSKFEKGQCLITYEQIQEATGAKRGQVDHFIRWSKRCKMLVTERATGGMHVTLLNYPFYQDLGNYRRDTMRDRGATEARQPIYNNNETIKQLKTKSLYAQNGFSTFWTSYPKKKNKGDAEKAWKALKPDKVLLETIVSAIEAGKKSNDWVKDGGQFIPYPATWLRAKGWDDEEMKGVEHDRFRNIRKKLEQTGEVVSGKPDDRTG